MAKKRAIKEQKAVYELWRQGGLTSTEFCRQNHISTRSLWLWQKQFGPAAATNNSNATIRSEIIKDVKFYPIKKVESNAQNNSLLEITLPNGTICKAQLSESGISIFLRELIK
jgi:hypothetical protein